MKLSRTLWVVLLLGTGLAVCFSSAMGAEWKQFAEATTGIFHYDTASLSFPSSGIVRVWIHNVTKHETSLIELNCQINCYRVLDLIEYDETGRVKKRYDYYDNPNWLTISPKSVPEPLRAAVCP